MKKPRDNLTRFGEILRARGERKAALARAIGEQPPTLQKLDDGTNEITPRMARKLAAHWRISTDDIYAPVGSPIPADSRLNAGQLEGGAVGNPQADADAEQEAQKLMLVEIWGKLPPDIRHALLTLALGCLGGGTSSGAKTG